MEADDSYVIYQARNVDILTATALGAAVDGACEDLRIFLRRKLEASTPFPLGALLPTRPTSPSFGVRHSKADGKCRG
jgi:hypothetical protein